MGNNDGKNYFKEVRVSAEGGEGRGVGTKSLILQGFIFVLVGVVVGIVGLVLSRK